MGAPARSDRIYELLADDGEVRVCRDIPESACTNVPRNFVLQLSARILTKLGDQISSPKVVLPWLLATVGGPAWAVGWLVPVRESGSLLPQLVAAALLRRRPVRKHWWVAGSVIQGAAVGAMGVVAVSQRGVSAAVGILALLAVFSLARGVCSVVSKDVVGKTVPKTRRGRLGGASASVAGALAIATGLGLQTLRGEQVEAELFLAILLAAGAAWWVAALLFSRVEEEPGATEGGGNPVAETLENLTLLWKQPTLGRFVLTRALFTSTALVAPFYVVLARDELGGEGRTLGLLLVAQGLASAISSYAWGLFADRSSRWVLILAGVLAAGLAGGLFLALQWAELPSWSMVGALFVLGVSHAGVRLGRKTYVVDLADASQRSAFVAVSNTLIGVWLVVGGAIVGWLATLLSPAEVILVLGGTSLLASALAWGLPEVQEPD